MSSYDEVVRAYIRRNAKEFADKDWEGEDAISE